MLFSDKMILGVYTGNSMIEIMKRMNQIRISARKLLDVVGDGDNGPLPSFAEAWYELSDALDLCDMEVSKANGQVDKPEQGEVDI
jgi:hypothetical protein